MPLAYEIRDAAWRKMKRGGLLPVLAGFAIVALLGSLVDMSLRQFGLWRGWIQNISAPEFFNRLNIVCDPEVEQALESVFIPLPHPAYWGASFLATVAWEGVLAFGCAVLAISVMRGGAIAFQVFSGFRWPFRTASLGLLRVLLVFLWSLLLIVPGICAAYSYRMAFLLLADHPDWSPWKAVMESKKLMNGHRLRLFCLDASFFVWFLLVGVTFGRAGIFVVPYYATANAAFYEDLLDRTDR